MHIGYIIRGQRRITAAFALCFSKSLGQTPRYWMDLQSDYDLALAEQTLRPKLATLLPFARRRRKSLISF